MILAKGSSSPRARYAAEWTCSKGAIKNEGKRQAFRPPPGPASHSSPWTTLPDCSPTGLPHTDHHSTPAHPLRPPLPRWPPLPAAPLPGAPGWPSPPQTPPAPGPGAPPAPPHLTAPGQEGVPPPGRRPPLGSRGGGGPRPWGRAEGQLRRPVRQRVWPGPGCFPSGRGGQRRGSVPRAPFPLVPLGMGGSAPSGGPAPSAVAAEGKPTRGQHLPWGRAGSSGVNSPRGASAWRGQNSKGLTVQGPGAQQTALLLTGKAQQIHTTRQQGLL